MSNITRILLSVVYSDSNWNRSWKKFYIFGIFSTFFLDSETSVVYHHSLSLSEWDFAMCLFRENKYKQLTSHKVATVLMRTFLPALTTRTFALGIIVCWPKEAAP